MDMKSKAISESYEKEETLKEQFDKAEKEIKKKIIKPGDREYQNASRLVEKGFGKEVSIVLDNYMENVEEFWQRQPFFYDKTNIFWVWDNNAKKYVQVDDVQIMLMLDDVLGFKGQTVSSRIKSNYLEAFKRVGRLHIPKDAPKRWIQFKNRAFSLRSGEIYEVTPDYFFTNPIPWEIGDASQTPIIDRLIKEWVGEKYVKTAKQIIAYCCLNDYPIHLIFCLIGCGRNGKSKFLGLVNRFVGKDNICSTELDSLINSRFESYKLYKKLVCTMGETNFGIISKTSMLKKLTGQDLIGFEFKNKPPFDDHNYAKIIISSNSLPTSEDTSEGFYRRWMILDFPNTFPEGKDILQQVPEVEFEALARQVIQLLPELLENGKFDNQGTIEERRHKYIMSSNPLSHFIKIACVRELDAFMRYGELYTMYSQYLDKLKKRQIGYKEFNRVLANEGLEVEKTTKGIDGKWVSTKFILGIRANEDYKTRDSAGIMTDMTVMTNSSLNSPYRATEWDYNHNEHNEHKPKNTPVSIGDILKIFEVLEDEHIDGNVPIESFITQIKAHYKHLTDKQCDTLIEKAKREGELYEVKRGYLRRL